MAMGWPKVPLKLGVEQREQLEGLKSRSLPAGLVLRARIVLRGRENQPGDCGPTGSDQRDGEQVAAAIPGTCCERTARPVAPGPAANGQ
jgi:hypothetical protein